MPFSTEKTGDLESGTAPIRASPDHRWSFIRKVYCIISIQLLLTVAVATAVVFYHPIATFFTTSKGGLACFIVLLIVPFITLIPMFIYHKRHPANLVFLGIFTVSLALAIGLSCSFTSSKVILQAAILTTVVVISLILFTFWATFRGYDFSMLGPFLFGVLMLLLTASLIQIFFPLCRISRTIYGGLGALLFSVFIVFDTYNLVEVYSYDEYVMAAISLYLDIINLFLHLLAAFGDTP